VRPTLVQLTVADPAAAWAELGFSVDGGTASMGTVDVSFDATVKRGGLVSWSLTGLAGSGAVDLDGLPTTAVDPPPPREPMDHPNGTMSIDHVVVTTPDLQRTLDALDSAGLELRRMRDAGQRQQAFYRIGETILEVVGPNEPEGDHPARLWGFVCTVSDLDATADLLGDRLGEPRPAVQPGRRIATVSESASISVPMAFMSPDRS
jgi:hypothetical protein